MILSIKGFLEISYKLIKILTIMMWNISSRSSMSTSTLSQLSKRYFATRKTIEYIINIYNEKHRYPELLKMQLHLNLPSNSTSHLGCFLPLLTHFLPVQILAELQPATTQQEQTYYKFPNRGENTAETGKWSLGSECAVEGQ
jgi:hypothetical protein